MTVDFPIVLNDIRGEQLEAIDIQSSMVKLPKTRIDIKGNRLVGADLFE